MTVTLYYAPGLCSLGVHIFLKTARIPYELVKVDIETGKCESGEDYSAINPSGAVPALKLEDGSILTQNVAIYHYLSETSKFPAFYRTDVLAQARIVEGLGRAMDLHDAVCGHVFMGLDDKTYKRRLHQFESRVSIPEGEPTQADYYSAVVLNWTQMTGKSLERWPKTEAFYRHIFALPNVQACLKEEGL